MLVKNISTWPSVDMAHVNDMATKQILSRENADTN